VFPYFLTVHLPSGMAGLFMASLMGAAMSGLASDLNCLGVVGVEDFYRFFRPNATDRRRLIVGKWIIAFAGLLCVIIALVLAHSKGSALSLWFSASAVASGGLAGLFLLAFFSKRANRQGVYIGILATIVFTAWATLTNGAHRVIDFGACNYPWNDLTIGAVGHLVLVVTGYLGSLPFPAERTAGQEMTFWKWLRVRKSVSSEAVSV
jgi:solute:Na+ symporter, SSS family